MKLYGAIDLHSNNNVTVLIDEQDRVVYEKRLPNNLAMIAQQLSGYQESLQGIVVESTYNWYWLVGMRQNKGSSMELINTPAIIVGSLQALPSLGCAYPLARAS